MSDKRYEFDTQIGIVNGYTVLTLPGNKIPDGMYWGTNVHVTITPVDDVVEIKRGDYFDELRHLYICESCSSDIEPQFNYCPICGKRITWLDPEPDAGSELKPCPFCGETDISVFNRGSYWHVHCLNSECCAFLSDRKTREIAVEDWNRRAGDCGTVEAVKLEQRIKELEAQLNAIFEIVTERKVVNAGNQTADRNGGDGG